MIVENVVVGIYDGTVNTNGVVLKFNETEFKDGLEYPILKNREFFLEDPTQVIGMAKLRFNSETRELVATRVMIYDELMVDIAGKFLCCAGYGRAALIDDNLIFDYTVTGLFLSPDHSDSRIKSVFPRGK